MEETTTTPENTTEGESEVKTEPVDAASILYKDTGEEPDSSSKETEAKDKEESEADKLPDKYEFKSADGREYDPVIAEELSLVSRELKLTNEKANEVFGKLSNVLEKRQLENVERVHKEWSEASRADEEFGGKRLDENLRTARKAVDKFGTPELRAILNETGLGNHPELIRFMYRAGKAISEDAFVGGQKTVTQSVPKDFNARAEALYSTHKR